MTVKECYQMIGDYQEAVGRLGNDTRILKYLDKFRRDQSFTQFGAALEQKDYHQAFVCIHNLKGLYLNLALTKAGKSASELCEVLRNGAPQTDITQLIRQAQQNHRQAVEAVNALMEAQPGGDSLL